MKKGWSTFEFDKFLKVNALLLLFLLNLSKITVEKFTFTMKENNPMMCTSFEELSTPCCNQEGSTFSPV